MFSLFCLAAFGLSAEADLIRDHIRQHYFNAMYTAHDADAMRAGFHPEFRMIVWWDGAMSVSPRDAWIDKVMAHPAPDAEKAASYKFEIPVVWVAGDAAAVRIEIARAGLPRYSDFFMLCKVNGHWQVLAKTFHYHKDDAAKARSLEADRRAIGDLIEACYLSGFASGFSAENLRQAFHDAFRMVTWREKALTVRDRETWIERLLGNGPAALEHRAKWSWRIPAIEVAGEAAMARIELSHDGQVKFIDFLLLYRVKEGWKVVEKAFDHKSKPG